MIVAAYAATATASIYAIATYGIIIFCKINVKDILLQSWQKEINPSNSKYEEFLDSGFIDYQLANDLFAWYFTNTIKLTGDISFLPEKIRDLREYEQYRKICNDKPGLIGITSGNNYQSNLSNDTELDFNKKRFNHLKEFCNKFEEKSITFDFLSPVPNITHIYLYKSLSIRTKRWISVFKNFGWLNDNNTINYSSILLNPDIFPFSDAFKKHNA